MICDNRNRPRHATCMYGDRCCASSVYASGHKRMRRTLKRRERQALRLSLRAEFSGCYA